MQPIRGRRNESAAEAYTKLSGQATTTSYSFSRTRPIRDQADIKNMQLRQQQHSLEDFQDRSQIQPIEGVDYEEFAQGLEQTNYADQVDDHVDEEQDVQFRAKVDRIRNGIMALNQAKPSLDAKLEKKAHMVKLLQQLSKTDVARLHLFMANEKKAACGHFRINSKGRASRAEPRKRGQALASIGEKHDDRHRAAPI